MALDVDENAPSYRCPIRACTRMSGHDGAHSFQYSPPYTQPPIAATKQVRQLSLTRKVAGTLRLCLLRLVLGKEGMRLFMTCADAHMGRARSVDIVTRKDGIERRFQADWVKLLVRQVNL